MANFLTEGRSSSSLGSHWCGLSRVNGMGGDYGSNDSENGEVEREDTPRNSIGRLLRNAETWV